MYLRQRSRLDLDTRDGLCGAQVKSQVGIGAVARGVTNAIAACTCAAGATFAQRIRVQRRVDVYAIRRRVHAVSVVHFGIHHWDLDAIRLWQKRPHDKEVAIGWPYGDAMAVCREAARVVEHHVAGARLRWINLKVQCHSVRPGAGKFAGDGAVVRSHAVAVAVECAGEHFLCNVGHERRPRGNRHRHPSALEVVEITSARFARVEVASEIGIHPVAGESAP